MKTVPRKLAAAIIVLGFATSASYAASVSTAALPQGSQASPSDVPVTMLAKKGADDPKPQPRPDDTGCDDNGTDSCRSIVAKKGADDPRPEPESDDVGCDDHGSDRCRATVKQV